MQIGSYSSVTVPVDSAVSNALPSASIVARRYFAPDGLPIDLTLVTGTDRSALHDPRSCLTGGGWTISADHQERLASGCDAHCCVATSPDGGSRSDFVYFYVIDRTVISSPSEIREALLASALIGREADTVEFVRLTAPEPISGRGGFMTGHVHAQVLDLADLLRGCLCATSMKGEAT
jgi:hypothetical protein